MAREKLQLALSSQENKSVEITMTIGLDEKLTLEISQEFEKLTSLFGSK